MILLEIQSIKKIKPIKWESKDLSGLSEGQKYVQFVGDHPYNPEYGNVILSTKLISGEFEDIDQVLFIGGPQSKLVSFKKQFLGGYKIEVHFNSIYSHGLKYSINNFIHIGTVLIGLTKLEKASLSSINTQKTLLGLLAKFIIPNKRDIILNFAKSGYLLVPNDRGDESISHFLGSSNHDESEIKGNNGKALFHLATFNLNDSQLNKSLKAAKKNLSFYLRISDTNNGWPQEKGDFKVLTNDAINLNSDSNEFEKANNFEIKPLLDLPGYNHSLLHVHKFSKDDRIRYSKLVSVYMQLVLGDEITGEANKFLGFADSVQNCVTYEAERVFNKREYSDEIYEDAVNWTLLLQVSPYCKWFKFYDDFGDGTIYYMIKESDLNEGNFNNCQVIVQNT